MKIIIAGDGNLGTALTRQLSAEGYDLTVIDSSQSVLDSVMENYDVIGVRGNCAVMDTLIQAGVREAQLLIAATSADEVNLLCCTMAHGINNNIHTIARIRNPEYNDQLYSMRDSFGLSMAVNPDAQAAVEIERLLKYPGFLRRDSFDKGRTEIVELRVDADSKLRDVSLSAMNSVVGCKVLVCAVLRNGGAVAPDGAFVLKEGDRVFVTAPTDDMATMLKNLGKISRPVKNVILAGGSRIGYYLARQLERSGMDVTLVDGDRERCTELAGLLPRANIVYGDARNQSVLDSEGISRCDALVSLTGVDETNMILSLYAHSRSVPQVITKLRDSNYGSILDSLSLGSVICPKELCCNTIVHYVRAMQNQTGAAIAVHFIADGQAEAMEFIVDENTRHCGETLKEIKLRKNVLLASISHMGRPHVPGGSSTFTVGDSIIIVTGIDSAVRQLNDIFDD